MKFVAHFVDVVSVLFRDLFFCRLGDVPPAQLRPQSVERRDLVFCP